MIKGKRVRYHLASFNNISLRITQKNVRLIRLENVEMSQGDILPRQQNQEMLKLVIPVKELGKIFLMIVKVEKVELMGHPLN